MIPGARKRTFRYGPRATLAALCTTLPCAGLFACGGDEGDGCKSPAACATRLEPTDRDGAPWPSYSGDLESARAKDCPQLNVTTGTCGDGKRYISFSGGYTGSYHYFEGERLVGVSYWSDVASCECMPGEAQGDVYCRAEDERGSDVCSTP